MVVNVFLKHNYIKPDFMSYLEDGIWDGKTESLHEEKLLGTFLDDQEAEKWVKSEKENNPIFKMHTNETEELASTYDLVLEKVSFINSGFHVDEKHLESFQKQFIVDKNLLNF